jgi:hypothetical protein
MHPRLVLLFAVIPALGVGAEKAQNLFDGKTTAGWTSKDGSAPGDGWKVDQGCIVRMAKAGDLYTKASFKNFDFSFEWKIVAGCNSGVKYRVADYSGSVLGPEYQVLDDAKWKYKSDHKGAAGGLYAIKGPRADKSLKPVGEFNTSRIVAKGSRLEHWLNGEVVVEMEIGSAEWEALHAASKFKKRPDFGTKKGRIMLQDHGGKVWFRNLKIREL